MDKVDVNSPPVQSYLTILQSVIARMATSSGSCKTWCITLVSAVIVIIADKGKPTYVWISVMPIVLFALLDAYYLSLERDFRDIYNRFIRRMHTGDAKVDDIFFVAPKKGVAITSFDILKAACSISIWPFYSLLALMLIVMRAWIL